MNIDRRKLKTVYYVMVNQITFIPPTRASVTWVQQDNVVFKGTLEQVLLFALQNFSVAGVAIHEDFALVSERDFRNMLPTDDVTIFDLDPQIGNNLIVAEEVLLVEKATDGYRRDWSEQTGLITEAVAGGAKSYWKGSRLATLAYLAQFNTVGADYIYNLYKWAFMDMGRTRNFGAEIIDLLGTQGPTDIEQAHINLGMNILNS